MPAAEVGMRWKTRMAAAFVFVAAATAAGAEDNTVTVIRAGTLIDGRSDTPLKDQVIVVSGHRIESVGPAGAFTAPDGAKTIDLSQGTVLPGLIDSHTHLLLQGEEESEGGYDAQL
jgi:imidazolonepropionase-like amidohydrolase